MTKLLKIGGSVHETLNLDVSTDSRRSTKKSARIGAKSDDNPPTSPNFHKFCSPTVGRRSV